MQQQVYYKKIAIMFILPSIYSAEFFGILKMKEKKLLNVSTQNGMANYTQIMDM